MEQPVIKPISEADLTAARTSWEKVRDEPDHNRQIVGVLLWTSVWAEPLMRAAAIGLMVTDKRKT